jgi:uncharacterized sulfatase
MKNDLNNNGLSLIGTKLYSLFYTNIKMLEYFKEAWFYYAFFAILIKSFLMSGFILGKAHASINLPMAIKSSLPYLSFHFGPIALLLSFCFLLKGRKRLWYMWGANLFVSIVFFIDLWYLRGFSTMPSLIILQQTADLHNTRASILSMGKLIDLIFFIDIIVLLVLFIRNKKIDVEKKRKVAAFIILFTLGIASVVIVPIRVKIFHKNDNRAQLYHILDRNYTAYNVSPLAYHILDVYDVYRDIQPTILSEKRKISIRDWFSTKREILPDNKYKGMFKGKNLLMIQVESLEKFVINRSINGQEITPNINRLLNNSIFFNNFHEQVYEGTTSDAELMATTSVYPLKQGSTFFRYPYTTYNSLPNLLEGIGYTTMAMHADRASFWNWKNALTNIGFDQCIDSSFYTSNEIIGMGLSDGAFLEQSIPMIKNQKRPFYTYMITLTSHGPFDLPKKYRQLALESELDKSTLGGYFQSIHYTDQQIGNFLSKLEADGLLNNTVVVLYGDHEGPHKYYQSDIVKFDNKKEGWLHNYQLVPLIIYQKGLKPEKISTIGGQIDLLPTICYMMGIDRQKYEKTAMGRNLLNTNENFVVLKGDRYTSDKIDENKKKQAIKGVALAEYIIRGNYFKK